MTGQTLRAQKDVPSWRQLVKVARQRFNFATFRTGQRDVIQGVLAGRDVFGIMPTGAGKSLCFQLPALFLKGTVLVVSPLIALMQDQLAHLEELEIAGARLDSSITKMEQARLEAEIKAQQHDIVFLTPERLEDPANIKPFKGRTSLLVVDEAHCLSQWGHDFRPAYLQLSRAIELLGRPPILALTATASPEVIEDVSKALKMSQALVVQTGIERDNLFLEVRRTVNTEEKKRALLELLDRASGPAILYAATVKCVDELHEWLRTRGVEAAKYHGKLTIKARREAQESFMDGNAALMVATNAFGLGIDKPDVRIVIHWHFPGSVESYYQEVGRAGRDGKPALCTLLYRLEDKRIRSFFLGGERPHETDLRKILSAFATPQDRLTTKFIAERSALGLRRVSVLTSAMENAELLSRKKRGWQISEDLRDDDLDELTKVFEAQYQAEKDRLAQMMRYADTASCRMQFLRPYFGEPVGAACGHCDNCSAGATA